MMKVVVEEVVEDVVEVVRVVVDKTAHDYRMKMIGGKPHLLAPPEIDSSETRQLMESTRALMKPTPPDHR